MRQCNMGKDKELYQPSKAEILHWQQDRVTRWVLGQLHSTFRPRPSAVPPETLHQAWRDSGQQQVLEKLAKICDAH